MIKPTTEAKSWRQGSVSYDSGYRRFITGIVPGLAIFHPLLGGLSPCVHESRKWLNIQSCTHLAVASSFCARETVQPHAWQNYRLLSLVCKPSHSSHQQTIIIGLMMRSIFFVSLLWELLPKCPPYCIIGRLLIVGFSAQAPAKGETERDRHGGK